MRTLQRLVACLVCFVGAAAVAQLAQQVDFTGTYHMTGPTGTLTITLQQTGDEVTGKAVDDAGEAMLLEGEVDEGKLTGIATYSEMGIEFSAELRGRDTLVWVFEIQEAQGQEFILQRVRDPGSVPAPQPAGGNPLAGPAGKPDPGSYRHPHGWFTFKLPEGWRVLIEEPTSVILDAGKPGVFIFALSGHLEVEEVGRPVPAVFQEALPDLDDRLAQGMNIQADSLTARATALTQSNHPAAEASWAGALQTYDGPQPVKIWSGTAFDDDYFVLMLAVINPDEFRGLQPQLRLALATTRVLQAPTPAELERAAASSAQPSEDPLAGARDQAAQYSRRVTVNGTQIDDATLGALEQGMGVEIPDNDYWYDPICGAVGGIGGPGVAFFPAGLQLGGPLQADASGGGSGMVTGVFVNARELHPQDVAGLKSITGMVVPGRYWLDSQGNFGMEGGPVAGNLLLLARTRQTQGGGSEAWTRYKDFGGVDGKTHFGSFGDGDFYFSGAGGEWWPGK